MDALEDSKTLGTDMRSFPTCVCLHTITLIEGHIMAAVALILAALQVTTPQWLALWGLGALVVFSSWRAFQHERRLRIKIENACGMGVLKVAETYSELLKQIAPDLRHSNHHMIACLQKAGADKFTTKEQFEELFEWLEGRKFPHPWQEQQFNNLPPLAFFQFANKHVINFENPEEYSLFWEGLFSELCNSESPLHAI